MKYFNLFLISLVLLSSCVFSEKPQVVELISDNKVESVDNALLLRGDSIIVDTVIESYKIYYKVSISSDETTKFDSKSSDVKQNPYTDFVESILLNIQKTDTTSVVAYEII